MSEQQPGADSPRAVRRAVTGSPASIDSAARTVEVTWSTGARARNYVPGLGVITEELDMSPNAIRMGVLRGGNAPVLDTHNSWSARSVLGRVTEARVERGKGVATLKFSAADDVAGIWQRVEDGSLRSISVGYRVYRYEQIIDPATDGTVHRAVDWEPYEISVVPIPVDSAATVRGDQGHAAEAIEAGVIDPHRQGSPMDQQAPASPVVAAAQPAPAAATPSPAPAEASRSAQPAAPVAPAPAGNEDAVATALRAERDRTAALAGVVTVARARIPAAACDALYEQGIREGWSADVLRARLWDAGMAAQAPASVPAAPMQRGASGDDPAAILDAMADSLAVLGTRGKSWEVKPQTDRWREYAGWRALDLVSELMARRGERNIPRNPVMLAQRAFHTTSDFPLLLSAAANKMLMAAYQPATPTYRQIMARNDFRDFKPHSFLRAGDFPSLVALGEGGEIQAGTISEGREQVFLGTYARRIRVTRQLLVNDDLSAFSNWGAMIGRRVSEFENTTAYGIVNLNSGDGPVLQTGNARVFATAAARANKAASGTALDVTNLGSARSVLMQQKTTDGIPIALGDQMMLLVGPAQEVPARQLTYQITGATQTGNVNVLAGFVRPVVAPEIPGNRWYLLGDPNFTPIYTYGFLNGAEGPQVTTGPVQSMDGVEISVIHDFGVGALGFLGGYFNPGL